VKRRLLLLEGVDPDVYAAGIKRGARLHGSRTTKIFCMPTCHQARRVRAAYRVTFGSTADAQAAGYRPCKLCRPASQIALS
jgi:methylphosphotriester-DNA--protein-cysteine methyltransferase